MNIKSIIFTVRSSLKFNYERLLKIIQFYEHFWENKRKKRFKNIWSIRVIIIKTYSKQALTKIGNS
ncbi:hypothetical protein C3744_23785 [Priestia megaterium]|uniref:Uncharacterized protein n=1 Tax=Priestia megaterium TaxID=1404 RepID=A0A3D8WWL6_PRIMG|nr:hypothetical protein C3744_23785 [Priestia megaterium]